MKRVVDHLYGEVKYVPRPHAQPLRYRVASDEVLARTPDGSRLRMRIRRDVLNFNDPDRFDLYTFGEVQLEDGFTEQALIAVSFDQNHIVTQIRAVP